MLGTVTDFCSLEAVVIRVKYRSNVKSESAQMRLFVATAVELLKGHEALRREAQKCQRAEESKGLIIIKKKSVVVVVRGVPAKAQLG